jgi:hypothetical protein
MNETGQEKVLAQLGLAFKDVADLIKQNKDVPTLDFALACQRINPIFGHLGFAFKFAKDDFVTKVRRLAVVASLHRWTCFRYNVKFLISHRELFATCVSPRSGAWKASFHAPKQSKKLC